MSAIEEQFMLSHKDTEGVVTKEQLKNIFLKIEKPIMEEHLDFVMLKLFRETKRMDKL